MKPLLYIALIPCYLPLLYCAAVACLVVGIVAAWQGKRGEWRERLLREGWN